MTPSQDINPQQLTRTALDILTHDLESHGNVLSTMHRAALAELLDTFTGYVTGEQEGRQAFGLPTGMGKTSAVVAFIAALETLGHRVPLAVAASKVEALCTLKRDLVAHGVPAEAIGLKHSIHDATEASTGNQSRRIQLVTHARVRGGTDFALFGQHEGQPRALMVYDETLLRSDSFAFAEVEMRKALACLRIELESNTDPLSVALLAYLDGAASTIAGALLALRFDGDPHANGVRVELPFLEEHQLDSYRATVRAHRSGLGPWAEQLDTLLSVSQESLQVLTAEQGGGVVAVCEAVPRALRNVVILDASTPVRELVRLDPTVRRVESFDAADLKSFEAVEVHQLLASGGRTAIEGSLAQKTIEARAVSLEVLDIVKANEGNARAFLVFSFLPRRKQVDALDQLKRDLAQAGIDLTAKTADGRPRFNFLTWGNQDGLNGYEHCDVVIMAGVLHRSHIDIAAAVKAQVGHLAEPTPSDRLRTVIESEVAHVVYQGASRGSCRRIDNGKAQAMKLFLIHRSKGLRDLLDHVMPKAQWHYPEPKHLQKAAGDGKSVTLLAQLLAHLDALSPGADKVSSAKLKKAMRLGTSEAEMKAYSRCLDLLDPASHGWAREGRSLVRWNQYGFLSRTPET
ncbi:hypothetical protein [Methylibium sp.]|jgi:hypothetical protein|uniref:hypothetical protein n=1 Tax=Methylibium sp. TaxID=2067992 RepID=UPI003D0E8406